MAATTRDQGGRAEAWAAEFLEENGLAIIERNYRCARGEIDLIATDAAGYLCFIEVRYRQEPAFGSPAETVGPPKRRRIVAAAKHYIVTHGISLERPMRFDVLGVSRRPGESGRPDLPGSDGRPQGELTFDWIVNAFDETGAV